MGVATTLKAALPVVALLLLTVVAIEIDNLLKLDEALPRNANLRYIHPVFDFHKDSCFPSAAISRRGTTNAGLKPMGPETYGCRNESFMDLANTYHRYACVRKEKVEYCGHSFALYMVKDQTSTGLPMIGVHGWRAIDIAGHRHEWETVVIWTEDGFLSHATCSGRTHPDVEVPIDDGHPMVVYEKLRGSRFRDPSTSHKFRVATTDDKPENPSGKFETPTIASWFTMKGDGMPNEQMRAALTKASYEKAGPFPHTDDRFLKMLNSAKPSGFPAFTRESINKSQ